MTNFFEGASPKETKALVEHFKRARPARDWSALQDVQSRADMLKTCFADVVVNGSEEHPVIRAREHNKLAPKLPCKHPRRNLAKNVTVWINEEGYLSTNKQQLSFFQVRVLYCADCEYVIEKGATAHA